MSDLVIYEQENVNLGTRYGRTVVSVHLSDKAVDKKTGLKPKFRPWFTISFRCEDSLLHILKDGYCDISYRPSEAVGRYGRTFRTKNSIDTMKIKYAKRAVGEWYSKRYQLEEVTHDLPEFTVTL